MQLKNKNGISLITLIITIIILIILTTIVMRTTSDTPDEANFIKYKQEMKNVQVGIENVRTQNALKGTTEEKINAGFKKVFLENAPNEFVSFGLFDEAISGYLVDLELIGYKETQYGTAYKNYNSGDTLTFGEDAYDVFVYDAIGDIYYVKGLKYDNSMNYKL